VFDPPLNEVVQALAAKLGASPYYLFSPAILDSELTAETIRSESSIGEVLSMARSVDLALFGVGDLDPGHTTPIASTLSMEDWAEVREAGTVGAVCVRFYNRSGRLAAPKIDARTVGLTLDQLIAIPTKVGVAGGLRKLTAVLGALNGRLLDVLITDESLADALFDASRATTSAKATNGNSTQITPIALREVETGSPVGAGWLPR
jgi:DNA-binding transcriptional regulator LsrR (DeoR family)